MFTYKTPEDQPEIYIKKHFLSPPKRKFSVFYSQWLLVPKVDKIFPAFPGKHILPHSVFTPRALDRAASFRASDHPETSQDILTCGKGNPQSSSQTPEDLNRPHWTLGEGKRQK